MGPSVKEWPDVLEQAVKAHNELDSEPVHGPPQSVATSNVQEFLIQEDMARNFKHNKDLSEKRAATLVERGAFRAPIGSVSKFNRSFNVQWGDKQEIGEVKGDVVYGADGEGHDVKLVKPVDKRQSNVQPKITVDEKRVQNRRDVLEPIAQAVGDMMGDSRRMALTSIARRLNVIMPEWKGLMKKARMPAIGEALEIFDEFDRDGNENQYIILQ